MYYEERYAQLEALKKLRNNMALFGKHCFPTALRKSTPPFHSEVYANLADDEKRRVLIAAPRGTAKSTVTTLIYPLWRVAFKKTDEDLFIVIISESQAQSINFLSRIKYHLTHSKQFKEIEKFFETMPKLSHSVKLKNPNTGVESDVLLEGLASFFG